MSHQLEQSHLPIRNPLWTPCEDQVDFHDVKSQRFCILSVTVANMPLTHSI